MIKHIFLTLSALSFVNFCSASESESNPKKQSVNCSALFSKPLEPEDLFYLWDEDEVDGFWHDGTTLSQSRRNYELSQLAPEVRHRVICQSQLYRCQGLKEMLFNKKGLSVQDYEKLDTCSAIERSCSKFKQSEKDHETEITKNNERN